MAWGINDHNPKWCRDEINRLRARGKELLEANNRYQQEARDAKAALAARRAIVEKVDIVAKERDELAERVTELSKQIKAAGQRVGVIASRYGWRGGENNIDFISAKMEKMNGRIGILEEELEQTRILKRDREAEIADITLACNVAIPRMGPTLSAKENVERIIGRLNDLEIAETERQRRGGTQSPRVEQTITVEVSGMADLEKRVTMLEGNVFGTHGFQRDRRFAAEKG